MKDVMSFSLRGGTRASKDLPAIAVILVPILAFYALLLSLVRDLPYWDDYDAVLDFLEHLSYLSTTGAKLRYFAGSQHNEYRLMFENSIFVLQTKMFPHINFAALSVLGDAFVLVIFYLLWKNFLPDERDQSLRLQLFIPVSFLLFQLNYAETLNWTMASLQNLPVIAFSLACLSALSKAGKDRFVVACCCFALAVASSGNGFILYPVALLMLMQRRRRAEAGWLTAWMGVIAALYFYGYHMLPPQPIAGPSLMRSHPILKPLFALSFIGSAVGADKFIIRYATLPLGLILCAAIVWMMRRRYFEKNPTLSYLVLFVLLTVIAVSVMRSPLGYAASLASRYKIYSDLLVICVYEFMCRLWLAKGPQPCVSFSRRVLCVSVLFCIGCDIYGDLYLRERTHRVLAGARFYEESRGMLGPSIAGSKDPPGAADANNVRFRQIMHEAEAENLYRFPR